MADTSTGDISLSPEIEQFLQSAISMGQVKQSQQATRDSINEALGVFKSATPTEIAAVDDYTKASMAVNNIIAGAKATGDARRAAVLETYSTDPLAAGNVIKENADIMRESLAESRRLKDEINQKRSITFFDSPLEFIASKYELPSLIRRQNAAAEKYNSAESASKDAISLTTAAGGMITATQTGSALALATAQNDQLLATANTQKAQLAISGAKNKVSAFTELSNLDDKAFSQSGMELERRIQLARFKQWDLEAPDRAQQRTLRNEQLNQLLEDKQTKQQAQTAILTAYNFAAARLGIGQMQDPNMLAQLYKSKPYVEQMVSMGQDMMASGQGTANGGVNVTTDNIRYGNNVADTTRLLLESRAPVGTSDSPRSLIINTATKLTQDPAIGAEAKKNPAAFYAGVGDAALKLSVVQQKGIGVEDNNIYQAPPIVAVMDAIPEIKNSTNRFIRENILPIGGANPTGKTDPDVILGAAVATLKADPSRLAEVTDGINRFFVGAVRMNNAVKEYGNYGLAPQVTYMAKLKTGNLWGTSTYDMTKAIDVKTFLMKNVGFSDESGFGIGGFR